VKKAMEKAEHTAEEDLACALELVDCMGEACTRLLVEAGQPAASALFGIELARIAVKRGRDKAVTRGVILSQEWKAQQADQSQRRA